LIVPPWYWSGVIVVAPVTPARAGETEPANEVDAVAVVADSRYSDQLQPLPSLVI